MPHAWPLPSAQVMVYHGAKRAADVQALGSADVVLTTYSVLENEYRRWGQGGVGWGWAGWRGANTHYHYSTVPALPSPSILLSLSLSFALSWHNRLPACLHAPCTITCRYMMPRKVRRAACAVARLFSCSHTCLPSRPSTQAGLSTEPDTHMARILIASCSHQRLPLHPPSPNR